MGGLFSCLNPPESASRPLIDKQYGGGNSTSTGDDTVASSRTSQNTASTSSYSPALRLPPPKFNVSKRSASKRAAEASASRTNSGIFCRCGGPGSLIQLLPCKCFSLCLVCAQSEDSCPDCGTQHTDSIPSWKIA